MTKLFDCFLYHNEVQLLEIRLRLLDPVVDRFVIVCSRETFTGRKKDVRFPIDNPVVKSLIDKIELIELDELKGKTAWDRESFQRDQIALGLKDVDPADLVLISDIDEVPRPSVLPDLKNDPELSGLKVLELDYYNFKFNYKLFHGVQAVWPGPTICRFSEFTSPQRMRDQRWQLMENRMASVANSGWHFSFLSDKNDVSEKLNSFSHQEERFQVRTDDVSYLLANREGFHDHFHPGCVWGFVGLDDFICSELAALVKEYPALYAADLVDSPADIQDKIKRSIHDICYRNRKAVLKLSPVSELLGELKSRILGKLPGRRNLAKRG